MKNLFKNKVVSIIILIATLVLAGVAVFTAYRLYQLRQESVAPNAPTSEPAADVGTGVLPQCTSLSFTINSGACSVSMSPATVSLNIGQSATITRTASENTGNLSLAVTDSTIASVGAIRTLTCLVPPCPQAFDVTALRVGTTSITSVASTDATCRGVVNVTVLAAGQSPSPSPSIPASGTPTPTPTPPASCNNSCSTNSDCEAGLVCSNGSCKNASCTADSDCVCATATPTPSSGGGTTATATPTPTPTLPDAGVGTPTIVGAGLGILLILGALLLAL